MKVETPQISWHGIESDRGRNAPLLSCSVVESGLSSLREYGQVLATAGSDSAIHLWKLLFPSSNSEHQQSRGVHVVEPQLDTNPNHIVHLLALRRHERSVNAVRFSPDGLMLATAGDGGSIILWSIPLDKRGNDNGKHFWASVQKESDLDCKIIVGIDDGPTTEDIIDVAWSADSKSFAVSCIDHNAFVLECTAYNKWKCIAKLKDHTHYVQGVGYDPLGVYLATQGSDRTVRIYSKRQHPNSSKSSNREMFSKEAMIKYWPDEPKMQQQEEKNVDDANATKKDPKRYMYADEVMVESFFRRLCWTPDGAFLITPAAVWGDSFATLLFARHQFDQPVAILSGKSKPSVVVRTCPVLFQLPAKNVSTEKKDVMKSNLNYRSVFAVLTLDSVLLYDTYHVTPLAMARGLHYASLTDCAWTSDGRTLIVSSRDGYVTFISFNKGELGEVYTPPPTATPTSVISSRSQDVTATESTIKIGAGMDMSIATETLTPAELSSHFVDTTSPGGDSMEEKRRQQQPPETQTAKAEEGKPGHAKKRVALTLIRPLNSSSDRKLNKIDPGLLVGQVVGPSLSYVAESQTSKDLDPHSRSMAI